MFEESIKSAIAAISAVTALVSTRVRAIHAAQSEAKPYVAYNITDRDDPSPSHDGPSLFKRCSYDVVTVAETYSACAQISELIRDGLHGLDDYTANDVEVIWTRFQDETDIEQGMVPGSEKPLYVRSQTFRAMYRNET